MTDRLKIAKADDKKQKKDSCQNQFAWEAHRCLLESIYVLPLSHGHLSLFLKKLSFLVLNGYFYVVLLL